MTDRVRIGLAGAGVFGAYHAEKFAAHDGAVVSGVFDIDFSRAGALADRCNAAPCENYRELLQNADAIVIATPATSHFTLAQEALSNGRHLLVEKPLAMSVEQADALIRLAAANRVALQVGHQERYVCQAAGLFGDAQAPNRLECVRRVPRTGRCEDVSVAFDLMVHDIDIVRKLARSDVCSLRAEGDENEIAAEIILENGAVVSLLASRRARAPERRMAVSYADRFIEFDFINRTMIESTAPDQAAAIDQNGAALALRDPLAYGAALFIAAVRGETSDYVTGADGRACIEWADRIEKAAGLLGRPGIDLRERLRA